MHRSALDNAVSESFNSTLQFELLGRHHFATCDQTRSNRVHRIHHRQKAFHQRHAQPGRLRAGMRNATCDQAGYRSTQRREGRMNPVEAASPPRSPLAWRRARLRACPSGLKGRCRVRCTTGWRPAPDPRASMAPQRAAARAGAGRCPPGARRQARTTKIKSLQPSLYGYRGLPLFQVEVASRTAFLASGRHEPVCSEQFRVTLQLAGMSFGGLRERHPPSQLPPS
jgi:hypothetical protein